ncbi:hypothetical protein JW898_04915 [Candidatus Woesearchaeota archaeon]|nr:hypothetical protein [Candidatus Woesearchaeota archaeon]
MKNLLFTLIVFFSLLLAGCYREAPVMDEPPVQETTPPAEEQIVHVLEPEEVSEPAQTEAPIEEEKQLVTAGATDIKNVTQTILSDIKCDYGAGGPEAFSFKMTNVEDKKWKFNALSYSDRETFDNPIVVLNALQVTNSQMQIACGVVTLLPGASAICEFNIDAPEHKLVKKSLRSGETAMGNTNENTLSFRTVSHAAQVRFLCESSVTG